MKRTDGFTLLELMVVVVLIGLVATMILPEMKGTFHEMLLRSTARDLVSALGLASSQAVTVHQTHRLRLDPRSGRYFLERTSGPSESASRFVPVTHVPGSRGELDRRITIVVRKTAEEADDEAEDRLGGIPGRAAAGDAFAFYPDGTAEAGEVVLRGPDGLGLAVRINPITARVRVMDLPRQ